MAKKKKYYVVWQGVTPGIYETWAGCQLQIKGYPGARYKSFKTKEEAEAAYLGTASDHMDTRILAKGHSPESQSVKPSKADLSQFEKDIVWDSISVDAACSGNPGLMEYQGVDTKSRYQFFHQKFELGTNNIGEFLAIVHALAMFKKEGKNTPIYTDSRNAIIWVNKKKCKTTLVRNARTEKLHQVIQRAETWLKNNSWNNPILKWETKKWGEIPADFGRK
ncbi:MAG TPA: ribonuclease H [Bacteroidetes bacterium]|nr:ribonuclease H [Bacteroidota bacterium]